MRSLNQHRYALVQAWLERIYDWAYGYVLLVLVFVFGFVRFIPDAVDTFMPFVWLSRIVAAVFFAAAAALIIWPLAYVLLALKTRQPQARYVRIIIGILVGYGICVGAIAYVLRTSCNAHDLAWQCAVTSTDLFVAIVAATLLPGLIPLMLRLYRRIRKSTVNDTSLVDKPIEPTETDQND